MESVEKAAIKAQRTEDSMVGRKKCKKGKIYSWFIPLDKHRLRICLNGDRPEKTECEDAAFMEIKELEAEKEKEERLKRAKALHHGWDERREGSREFETWVRTSILEEAVWQYIRIKDWLGGKRI